jgi:hypothetical protein
MKLLGTELAMSTAYHPQSDGQTERMNMTMEDSRRCERLKGSRKRLRVPQMARMPKLARNVSNGKSG